MSKRKIPRNRKVSGVFLLHKYNTTNINKNQEELKKAPNQESIDSIGANVSLILDYSYSWFSPVYRREILSSSIPVSLHQHSSYKCFAISNLISLRTILFLEYRKTPETLRFRGILRLDTMYLAVLNIY